MTAPTDERPQPAPPVSVIVITFDGPGSARFVTRAENVTPEQLAIAAAELDYLYRQHRMMRELPQQLAGLSLPGMPGFAPVAGGTVPRG